MKYVGTNALQSVISLVKTAIAAKGDKSAVYTVTLPATAASYTAETGGYGITFTVNGIATTGYGYFASPSPACRTAYLEAGAYMREPAAANRVVMHVDSIPESAVSVYVMKVQVS